jgi:hypothetical protein
MSALEWFAVIAGGASVASLPVALVLGWFGKRTAVDIHAATQSTLADISKGFRESQEHLGESLGHILERMDQRADERQREMQQVIEALRR